MFGSAIFVENVTRTDSTFQLPGAALMSPSHTQFGGTIEEISRDVDDSDKG